MRLFALFREARFLPHQDVEGLPCSWGAGGGEGRQVEGSTIFLVRVPLVDQEARLRSRAHPQPGAPGSPGCPPASPGALHDVAGPGHFAVTGTAPRVPAMLSSSLSQGPLSSKFHICFQRSHCFLSCFQSMGSDTTEGLHSLFFSPVCTSCLPPLPFFIPVLSHACPPPPPKQGMKGTAVHRTWEGVMLSDDNPEVTRAPPLKAGRGVCDSVAGHVLKMAAVLSGRAFLILLVLALSRACAQKDELSDGCRPARQSLSVNLHEALMAFGPPWP